MGHTDRLLRLVVEDVLGVEGLREGDKECGLAFGAWRDVDPHKEPIFGCLPAEVS